MGQAASNPARAQDSNASATPPMSEGEEEPFVDASDGDEAEASGSGLRRRRRTSSGDEQHRKRRHRGSALRRLGQLGSNVVHSLAPSDPSREERGESSGAAAAQRLRPLSDMFSEASSSLSSLSSADSAPRSSRPFQLFDRLFSNDPLPPLSSLAQRSERRPVRPERPPAHSARRPSLRPSLRAPPSAAPLDPLLRERPAGEGSFEYQAAMLSRLLAIAASVTASSIMGDRDRRGVSVGRGGEQPDQDNSFSGFINGLHNGLLVSELANSAGRGAAEGEEGEPRRSSNFFRMFRFPPSQPAAGEGPGLVPVLIVGVRAVDGTEEEANGAGVEQDATGLSFFDAMSSRSIRMNGSETDEPPTESTQQTEHRPQREPANSTEQTHSAVPNASTPVPLATETNDYPATNDSATNPANVANNLVNFASAGESSESNDDSNESLLNRLRRAHQTRMQSQNLFDSIFRPDRAQGAEQQPAQSDETQPRRQSWIIYVIGGSYPEDHPILLAPSLFTDNPTYEDMLVLERVLGQAKPPVATAEEVTIAGGLYKIGDPEIQLRPEERCLVCLSSYETGEEVRKLKLCGHLFHQECIDQWLTTGRNSCPLCRGEGVQKASPEGPHADCS